MISRFCILPLLGIALLSVGCSVLPRAKSPESYRLPQTSLLHTNAPPVAWSLRIETPRAEHTIDSNRIAVLPEGDVVSVYQDARWSDNATTLLRNRLVDGFRDDGRVGALMTDDDALPTDYELDGELRAFQSEYQGGAPNIVVRYNARLVERRSLRIVAARSFDVRQPVGGIAVPSVVVAFGQTCDTLSRQIVEWVFQQPLRADRPDDRSR